MKLLLRILPPATLLAALLVGCATIPSAVFQTKRIAPAALKLSIGYDVALVRVDLRRATHLVPHFVTERDGTGVMKLRPEPIEAKNAYSYLVASFGNGLVLDEKGNLGIDLLRLYRLRGARGVRLVERFAGPFVSGRSVSLSGTLVSRRGIGLTVEQLDARADGNVVHLRGEVFFPHMRIVRGTDALSLEPAGRRTSVTVTIEQPAPGEVLFPGIGGTMTIRRVNAFHIRSSDGLDITRTGEHLSIVLHAPGGIAASFLFTRTRDGCLITSGDGYPTIRIARVGDTIYVTSGRFLAATVAIRRMQDTTRLAALQANH